MNLEHMPAPQPAGTVDGVWPVNARRLNTGELEVAGVPLAAIAQEYGTPGFVLDVCDMRGRARTWVAAMNEAFADLGGARVYYAGKAFLSKAVARWMAEDGLSIDTASEGELRTVLAAGVPGRYCGLHGNNKTREEIELAITSGVAHIVIDSLDEIDFVEAIASELGQVAPVYLRLTTGVHAGGHEFIATAHEDQKFGLSVSTGVSREAIKRVAQASHLNLIGLHSHIGSQIAAVDGFEAAAAVVFAERTWASEQGIDIPEIDLGGGYGIRYTSEDPQPPTPETFARALASVVSHHMAESGLEAPHVSIEPGRSIIGPSMLTLYCVGTTKDVAIDGGARRYVSVDGGMSDNIRPALYEANYTAALANRSSEAEDVRSRVVGKHCESGDIVVRDVALPSDVHRGDLLAIPATGAYGYAMASNYNMLTKPPVVAVENGEVTELIRRQNVDDLLAYDLG
ncbi:MAG: diaminopimelate decarboxylase [Actinomycetaceae bacterium]|nr:diaminopimelate decarboxylase [Arcanobacterium sp.]MDD7504987.1 diaminopimelate decarboxylase [Actinomycetaceae bacterium]MDY6143356.1 diaminopimelate decarboxylase [Arcanobacterium sp.]